MDGLRSFRDRQMDKHFMELLVRQIDRFVTSCGAGIKLPAQTHKRGRFAQAITGYSHGMGAGDLVGVLF
jgi:hypothetical protein